MLISDNEALGLIERAVGMPSPFAAVVLETGQLILQRLGKSK
jgi:hypothetical protein